MFPLLRERHKYEMVFVCQIDNFLWGHYDLPNYPRFFSKMWPANVYAWNTNIMFDA